MEQEIARFFAFRLIFETGPLGFDLGADPRFVARSLGDSRALNSALRSPARAAPKSPAPPRAVAPDTMLVIDTID